MFCGSPLIGVLLVTPNGTVEIAYYAVTGDNFPEIGVVLDGLVTILGYLGLKPEYMSDVHRYKDAGRDCVDPPTKLAGG